MNGLILSLALLLAWQNGQVTQIPSRQLAIGCPAAAVEYTRDMAFIWNLTGRRGKNPLRGAWCIAEPWP